jgi:hypothetical protein
MKDYRNNPDAVFGGVLLLTSGVSATMVLATVALDAVNRVHGGDGFPLHFLPNLVPHIAFLLLSVFVRRRLLQSTVPSWAHMAVVFCVAATLWSAFIWFRAPMHDIGLVFDSHGRWGCRLVDADGSPQYFIRDNTVPWMIFSPLILAATGHWIWSRRQQAQNTTPDGIRRPADGSLKPST